MTKQPPHSISVSLNSIVLAAWNQYGARERGCTCPLCGHVLASGSVGKSVWESMFAAHLRYKHWSDGDLKPLMIQLAMGAV